MHAHGHGGQILCSEVTAELLQRGGLVGLESGLELAELGSYTLRDVRLPERLFQVNYPGMSRPEFPPLKAASGYNNHLPQQFTRFFGREAEIARLRELLTPVGQAVSLPSQGGRQANSLPHARLVTLTGPGGTGKTRLALEVAVPLVGSTAASRERVSPPIRPKAPPTRTVSRSSASAFTGPSASGAHAVASPD